MNVPGQDLLLPPRGARTSVATGRSGVPPARNRRRIKVQKDEKRVIVCEVEFDCELHSNKACFFQGMDNLKDFDLEVITKKDITDVDSCIKLGVDYLVMPYVRNAEDVKNLKDLLSIKGRNIKVLTKINDRISLQNIEQILEMSDGIVISRGFLGLDVPMTEMAFI
jgi:pyruvate kinase